MHQVLVNFGSAHADSAANSRSRVSSVSGGMDSY